MYCQRMQEENITRALIVVQQGMTPSAKQVPRRCSWQLGYRDPGVVCFWFLVMLQVNKNLEF